MSTETNRPTSPQECIVSWWNQGKSVPWIASRIEHRFNKPLERVIADYIAFLSGCQEFPGCPQMRPIDEGGGNATGTV